MCLDSGSTAENFLFVLKPYEDGSSTMRLETNPNQGIYTRKEYLPHPGGLKVTFHEDCSELWARLVSHLQCLRCWAAKSVQLEHKIVLRTVCVNAVERLIACYFSRL